MRRIAMIGFGSIGRWLNDRLQAEPELGEISAIFTRSLPREIAHEIRTSSILELIDGGPDLVIEAAGAEAFAAYIPTVLEAGIDVLALSSSAMAREATETAIVSATRHGGGRLRIASGAIGAVDALSAAREGGLERVNIVQRKPPIALLPEEKAAAVLAAKVIRDATARQICLALPKNANIVATAALTGIGFDATTVQVIADPEARENSVELEASGEFGSLKLVMKNRPSPTNPRSSVTPAMSLLAALRRDQASLIVPG